MKEKRFLSPGGLLLCALLVLAAGAAYLIQSLSPGGGLAIVEQNGQVVGEYELSQLSTPETLTIQGENGIQVVIRLSREGAAVVSSTCPDQVCVRTGELTRAGESAICLPARVTLRLEGSHAGVDATVY